MYVSPSIAYAIQGMKYYNQDLHDENFLYDGKNIYAIDFADIRRTNSNSGVKDTYIEDLNRRVTPEEIMEGLY